MVITKQLEIYLKKKTKNLDRNGENKFNIAKIIPVCLGSHRSLAAHVTKIIYAHQTPYNSNIYQQ